MNIFHFKKASGEYTSFNIDPTDTNDSVFISVVKGVKNGHRDRLSMKMNKQELAYIIMEGQRLYNSLDEKEKQNDEDNS